MFLVIYFDFLLIYYFYLFSFKFIDLFTYSKSSSLIQSINYYILTFKFTAKKG